MRKVCLVIVTYNRLACLQKAVAAALREDDADVLAVDNASTDGTREWLREQKTVNVLEMTENAGGAGGFSAGMRWAYEKGYEWIWLMDDDVVVLPGSLCKLLAYGEVAPSVQPSKLDAAGHVFEFEGIIHPHSFRRSRLPHRRVFKDRSWVDCTTANFEGMFMNRKVVEVVGYPRADFFLAWDDAYYGWLVSRRLRNIYVKDFCIQKQFDKNRAVIGGKRLFSSSFFGRYFHLRNFMRVIRLERLGPRAYLQYAYEWLKAVALTLVLDRKFREAAWLFAAARAGWSGDDLRPSTQAFLNRT